MKNGSEGIGNRERETRGRPFDEFSYPRARVLELRADAKRLETIAKKMRKQADDLANEIRVQMAFGKKEKGSFTSFHSSHADAHIEIEIPLSSETKTQIAIENLFEDDE